MMYRRGRRRRRILVSAYALSPVLGSEPGVGWNFCSRLAAYHDVTVLARSWNEALWPEDARHREEAERFIKVEGPFPGLTIHFVASPPLSRLLQPHPLVSLRSPFYFQGYAAWQRAAYREAVRLHREKPFDADASTDHRYLSRARISLEARCAIHSGGRLAAAKIFH